jgi:alanyl-tRNA synthetase
LNSDLYKPNTGKVLQKHPTGVSEMSRKKYDPAMHTAEHILNQTMDRLFKCGRSFNAHVEKKKSKCDYRFPRPLTDEEVMAVEAAVKRVIKENLPVAERMVDRTEAERSYFTGKLPAEAGERIRIVRVGDYDVCPCIGQHVRSTAEIPGFRIASTAYENGVLRIRFTLG